jgi:hypothetical protein
MKLKLISIGAILFFARPYLSYAKKDYFNENAVQTLAIKYVKLLSEYSNCHCSNLDVNWMAKEDSIINLFRNNYGIPAYDMVNSSDLLYFEDANSILEYLEAINQNYNNKIDMSFSNIYVSDSLFDNRYAIATAQKRIIFENIPQKVELIIILVDVSDSAYSLYAVYLQSDKEIQKLSRRNWKLPDDYTQINYAHYKYLANEALKKEYYFFALQYCNKAIEFNSNDSELYKIISLCKSKINPIQLVNEANKHADANEIEMAKQTLSKYNNEYSSFAIHHPELESINTKINMRKYDDYIFLAESRFKNGSYNRALKYFKKALEYIPTASYAKAMINKCETAHQSNFSDPYLSITYGFPSFLEGSSEHFATVTFTYDNHLKGNEAELEIYLPEGCYTDTFYAKVEDCKASHKDNLIKFIWKKLPSKTPFIIAFNVHVSDTIQGTIPGRLWGSFSYQENGTMIVKNFDNSF